MPCRQWNNFLFCEGPGSCQEGAHNSREINDKFLEVIAQPKSFVRVSYQPHRGRRKCCVMNCKKFMQMFELNWQFKNWIFKGIGRGIAVQLGEAGATVYITGRSVDKLKECAAEIQKRGGKVPIKSLYFLSLYLWPTKLGMFFPFLDSA